ncbi:MAG: polysaccharide deacetylase family protein [Candidatus Hodarchaeales archaeon]
MSRFNKNGKKIKILSSWDDGNQLDMTLADLLLEYKIPSIFYIPANCDLTEGQIRCLAGVGSCSLSKKMKGLFEIGSHSLSHPEDLKKLDDRKLTEEIAGSKVYLEQIIEMPVTKFCYPSGRYDDRVKEKVKLAGFKEARTVDVLNIKFPKDPFMTKPTIHVYPERKEYGDKTWIDYAHQLFDKVIEEGGRFELWGHSYEIELYNQWEFLEDFLWYMDKRMKEINYPRLCQKKSK